MIRLVVAVFAGLLALPAAAGADVTVNTPNDVLPAGPCEPLPGNCTLREALTQTPDSELVILPPGDYKLGSQITTDLHTVQGAGARTTIIRYTNLEQPGRVLSVPTSTTLTMSGVTVTGGRNPFQQGGGIEVEGGGALNLIDSVVTDNTADRGAGIYSLGTLALTRVLVSKNHAVGEESTAYGGGMALDAGSATLENTTISGNTAIDATPPNTGQGGGIYSAVDLDLHNVTIAENTAADGTFGDGGGLFQNLGGGPLRTLATNTLVARNDGGNCAGTVGDEIESTNGVSDNSTEGNCLAIGPNNQLVPDARLGGLLNNGGPSDTHALLTGSPGIDMGDAASCPDVDQRGTTRPRGTACDVGAYEFVPSPPSGPPPPPPDDGEELPPPVPHKNVNALPKSGTVKIKLPGSDEFVVLEEGQQIPLGTIVDARKGRVTIVAAAGSGQTADFYAGLFKLSQTKGKKPITVLTLVEKLSCPKNGKATTAAKKKKKKRRLWGDGRGRFRTKGKHSAATVVGTKWLVEDRCTSTLTRVVRGRVKVRDFVKKKTVLVKAGKKYVAKAKP